MGHCFSQGGRQGRLEAPLGFLFKATQRLLYLMMMMVMVVAVVVAVVVVVAVEEAVLRLGTRRLD